MIKLQVGQSVLIKAKRNETKGEYTFNQEFVLDKTADAKAHSAFGNPDDWEELLDDLSNTKDMKKNLERILWPEIKHFPGVSGYWVEVDCDSTGVPKTEAELLKKVSALSFYVTLTIEVELPYEAQTGIKTFLESVTKRI